MICKNGHLCICYNGTLQCEPGTLQAEPQALADFPYEKSILDFLVHRKASCLSSLITAGYCSPLAKVYSTTRDLLFLTK